jgi:citrate lyase gamma subunit
MKDYEKNQAIPMDSWNLLSCSFMPLLLAYTGDLGMFLVLSAVIIALCFIGEFVRRFITVLTGSEQAIKKERLQFNLEDPKKKELTYLNKGTQISYRIDKRKVSFFARTIQSGEVMIGSAPLEDGWIIIDINNMEDKSLKAFVHGDEIEMVVVEIEEDLKSKRLTANKPLEE